MNRIVLLLLCSTLCLSASALTTPQPTVADPRLQTVDYTTDIIHVAVELGKATQILFRPGEKLSQQPILGDAQAFVFAEQDNVLTIKPVAPSPATNMVIVTNLARYWFELEAGGKGPTAYQLVILYPQTEGKKPAAVQALATPVTEVPSLPALLPIQSKGAAIPSAATSNVPSDVGQALNRPYLEAYQSNPAALDGTSKSNVQANRAYIATNGKFQMESMGSLPPRREVKHEPTTFNERYAAIGPRDLEPLFVKDNGVSTFLKFGANQPLPAVFYIAPDGSETRVNHSMQDDVMILHRVGQRFVLRYNEQALCVVNLNYAPRAETPANKTVAPDVNREVLGDKP